MNGSNTPETDKETQNTRPLGQIRRRVGGFETGTGKDIHISRIRDPTTHINSFFIKYILLKITLYIIYFSLKFEISYFGHFFVGF